jgi:2-polyprenyl-6-methoxyphenol hydroxylase-like FAD-dependent oxidoreductase
MGRGRNALVIGAGTTGLLSAAALSRHFANVTVLERDPLPTTPGWRKGSPQSPHVHVLLKRGADIMQKYLPGALDDIERAGGHRIDMSLDTDWFYAGGWKARLPSGITMHSQSKGLLEFTLRQHLSRDPRVTVRERAEVGAFVCADGRIAGVDLVDGERLRADLIVDAGGRNSKTSARLEAAGFAKVDISEVPVDVGYATALLELTDAPRPWKSLLVHPKYPDARLGVLLPIEGTQKWLATLVGWRGDHPPDDIDGFMAFAKSLAVPDFYATIKDARPIERIWRYRFAGNLRRHFESMDPAPEGLVVVGDAASSFNPIYAQGMSQGATGAALLDETLGDFGSDLRGFTQAFQRRYARFVSQCWLMSTTEEYRDRAAFPDSPAWTRFANWYLDRVHELTWHDPVVALRFLEVMHLQKSPLSLATPGVFARVVGRKTQNTAKNRGAHVAHEKTA